MDKVFSTRLDEAVIDELDRVTRRLHMTKKRFLEEAIRARAQRADADGATDVWAATCGAWKRGEAPATTLRRARKALESSLGRHKRR